MITPKLAKIVKAIELEIDDLDAEDDGLPGVARDEVRSTLVGIRLLLLSLEKSSVGNMDRCLGEIVRAYMTGRRDKGGALGGATRRPLQAAVARVGIEA